MEEQVVDVPTTMFIKVVRIYGDFILLDFYPEISSVNVSSHIEILNNKTTPWLVVVSRVFYYASALS